MINGPMSVMPVRTLFCTQIRNVCAALNSTYSEEQLLSSSVGMTKYCHPAAPGSNPSISDFFELFVSIFCFE
jgi:hypothetical protein